MQGENLHFCYIDESGDSQVINVGTAAVQPFLIIGGLIVEAGIIAALTQDFIALKQQYYPGKFQGVTHALDVLLTEVKGSDIRTDIRKNVLTSNVVQHHFHFLDAVLKLCKDHNLKLVARCWVKKFGQAINDKSIYSITAQNIAQRFQVFLDVNNSNGMLIADFRDPARNSYVAHSVFTQKHKAGTGGDQYPRIYETATYGISDNHACLQIADLLISAILYPMAGNKIGAGVFNNVHTHAHYAAVSARYRNRIKKLQYNCKFNGMNYWGITVADPHNGRTGQTLLS